MTIFEQAKEALPPIEDVARHYGLQLNRQNRASCCFHGPDKHPSLSFKGRGFKCFACGEGGDAIKLTQQLIGARSPMEALKTLNHDFHLGLTLDKPVPQKAVQEAKTQRDTLDAFEEWELRAGRVWAAWCRLLTEWKENFAPQFTGDTIDWRYEEACKNIEYADDIFFTVFLAGSFADKALFPNAQRGGEQA